MTAGELWRDATESETVLWWMPVHSPPREAMARWLAILDKTEQARAERFRFAEDREIYVAAHALMRTLLSRFCPLPPSAWRFIAAPTGKPEIHPDMGVARIRFSLSHTRGLVACAAGRDDDIGVDVEGCERTANVLELAGHFFAPEETALVLNLHPEQRLNAFLRIWTLKEAYIKAIGQGLACPLDAFSFNLDPIAIRFGGDRLADTPDRWQFDQFPVAPRHVIALARRRAMATVLPQGLVPEFRVVRRQVRAEET
jgi:4'-phosphopantetheinyl transferase